VCSAYKISKLIFLKWSGQPRGGLFCSLLASTSVAKLLLSFKVLVEMEQSRGYGVEPLPLDSLDYEAPFCPHGKLCFYFIKRKRWSSISYRTVLFHVALVFVIQFFNIRYLPMVYLRWLDVFRESQPSLDRDELLSSLQTITSLPEGGRCYCYQCEQLLSSSAVSKHSEHSITRAVTNDHLLQPTKLLSPVDNRKSQAVSLHIGSDSFRNSPAILLFGFLSAIPSW